MLLRSGTKTDTESGGGSGRAEEWRTYSVIKHSGKAEMQKNTGNKKTEVTMLKHSDFRFLLPRILLHFSFTGMLYRTNCKVAPPPFPLCRPPQTFFSGLTNKFESLRSVTYKKKSGYRAVPPRLPTSHFSVSAFVLYSSVEGSLPPPAVPPLARSHHRSLYPLFFFLLPGNTPLKYAIRRRCFSGL